MLRPWSPAYYVLGFALGLIAISSIVLAHTKQKARNPYVTGGGWGLFATAVLAWVAWVVPWTHRRKGDGAVGLLNACGGIGDLVGIGFGIGLYNTDTFDSSEKSRNLAPVLYGTTAGFLLLMLVLRCSYGPPLFARGRTDDGVDAGAGGREESDGYSGDVSNFVPYEYLSVRASGECSGPGETAARLLETGKRTNVGPFYTSKWNTNGKTAWVEVTVSRGTSGNTPIGAGSKEEPLLALML